MHLVEERRDAIVHAVQLKEVLIGVVALDPVVEVVGEERSLAHRGRTEDQRTHEVLSDPACEEGGLRSD